MQMAFGCTLALWSESWDREVLPGLCDSDGVRAPKGAEAPRYPHFNREGSRHSEGATVCPGAHTQSQRDRTGRGMNEKEERSVGGDDSRSPRGRPAAGPCSVCLFAVGTSVLQIGTGTCFAPRARRSFDFLSRID